ncbi:hypothetical protein BG011_007434 [Mortierella polycephala]|uniref:Uncharacterized protein n=1 Tax=Mortierella polycephala TaxID=41804 RepID=A0A9P6PTG9_9FUNG|nr:hypothetical protein BG011_007434 [Mortierella polycephala]
MATNTFTTTEIQEIPIPAIAFAQEQDVRGRDHSITPLIEEGAVEQETKAKKPHRSSLAAFADRLRSRSRSHSRHRNATGDVPMSRTSTQASTTSVQSNASSKSRSGSRSRKSSMEIEGPYADVLRAQNEFMDKLRNEQEMNGVTHNADGIPIPQSNPTSRNGSRRSSITHILGLDKPLLAF